MKDKLETGAMLNPKCQKCSKKDTCNNKTLCAYLIPKKIKVDRVVADTINPAAAPIILTFEMLAKQIQKDLINKSLNIEINSGTDYIKNCYMERGK